MPPKLLLADGNSTIQRVVELTFAGEDVQVITVNDGEQAIARVQTERPDIVLADIGIPKRSGYDIAAFIKGNAALSHIPVLLLTGAFEPVDEARVRRTRCDGVLVKPFEPRQVIDRVRELLGGAAGLPMKATASVPRPIERLGPPQGPGAPRSGDAYFDQLDAALTARVNHLPADLPSPIASLAPPASLPQAPRPAPSMPSRVPAPPADAPTMAEAFSALLAMEQGDPQAFRGLTPVELRPGSDPKVRAPLGSADDELVNEITRRVADRIERLVREELARIRHT